MDLSKQYSNSNISVDSETMTEFGDEASANDDRMSVWSAISSEDGESESTDYFH